MNEKNNLEIMIVDEDVLRSKIYIIRGQKVILDRDLAVIYGYETKRFNEQVKNNIEKFKGDDFRFQLTEVEFDNLRPKFSTSSWGGIRYMPYAFTEQGIYMLMTVLKGELATKQSRALVRTFKSMKDYIVENQILLGEKEYLQFSLQTSENKKEILELKNSIIGVEEKITKVVDELGNVVTKSELSEVILDFSKPMARRGYLLLNGQPFKANIAYADIYNQAKKSIFVIDNYIGLKTLVHLKDVHQDIAITIFSDNIGKRLHKIEFDDFSNEYKNININLKRSGGIFHDRYIILDYNTDDEKIYHCGASSKDAGNRVTTISEVLEREIYHDLIDKISNNQKLVLR